MVTFLLVSNLAMWLLNTLETSRTDAHPMMVFKLVYILLDMIGGGNQAIKHSYSMRNEGLRPSSTGLEVMGGELGVFMGQTFILGAFR